MTLKIQMIFFHKFYYNPNYTNPDKKSPSDIYPKHKKLYKIYNAKYIFFQNIGKKNLTKI
jgi:hypothetical protein